jgi:chromosome segregation ATPase
MTWKTPPSLKWLIVKRSRLSGEVQNLEAERATLKEQVQQIENRLTRLNSLLGSLDHTFQLHEIQINPTEIATVVPQKNKRILPPGQMSRQIRRILASHDGWASTTEVTHKIIHYSKILVEDEEVYEYIHVAVRKRLRSMLAKGEVQRMEGPTKGRCYDGSNQSTWRLTRRNHTAT